MVSIRFARFGTKKLPFYHLVVTHSENCRDGRFLEQLGVYDPSKPSKDWTFDLARIDHWTKVGAQPSTRARHVINEFRRNAASAS